MDLRVTQNEQGRFEADPCGGGSPVVGRGSSVLEAVGEYAIQTGLVHVACDPPAVLREYRVSNQYCDLDFHPPAKRE
jgi:hypothetical protein